MQWNSAAEFLAMGDYGLYVWGAYVVTALLLGAELTILVRRGRTLRAASGRRPKADNPSQ